MDGTAKRALSYVSLVMAVVWVGGCIDAGTVPKRSAKTVKTVVPAVSAPPQTSGARSQGSVNLLSVATGGVAPSGAPWQAKDTDVLGVAQARVPVDGFSILAITETVTPCSGGGTATATVDNQPPPWFSQGDYYTTTYANCIRGTESINGARKFSVDTMVGQPYVDNTWSVATTMASQNLVRVNTVNGDTSSADGSATTTISAVGNAYTQASKGTWSRTHPNNGSQQLWAATFDMAYAWDDTLATYTWTFKVATESSLFGNTAAESLTPLAGTINQAPETGKLKLTQATAGVTTITLITAQGGGNALVEVDNNADGTIDSSVVYRWTDLMIDPILYQFF